MAAEKKLAVIVLHGIGTYSGGGNLDQASFDTDLRDALKRRLGATFDRVVWQRVVWSDEALEKRQADLIARRGIPGYWPWRQVFDFVSSFLSDASAYTLPPTLPDQRRQQDGEPREERYAYYRVQELVREKLALLEERLGADAATTPVFAIAHSMGCHVLSCYKWDAEHSPGRIPGGDLSPFQALGNLAGLAYVGCNLPLLTVNIPKRELLPIRLPLKPDVLGGADSVWLNFWEKNDLLGYPLAGEYADYFGGTHPRPRAFAGWGRDPARERPPRDIEVKRRGLLRGELPTVHSAYYRIGAVQQAIAAEIERLLDRP